ncbi:hypothetical protein PROFUN_00574 [Planoprotostelium fungivorum]|uniref:BLOC-1-related complex subunit 7 n=1 Tax=Planoprotostelium fungivorum TaxID=1890364 RepID=A0A2P6N194_9EUKA|nr:hypothetical protein PROFUN_00574 [Planoprotostelium fungivorum]
MRYSSQHAPQLSDSLQPMRIELIAKGENIVTELGLSSRSLLKNSEIHSELIKAARVLSSREYSIQYTSEMLNTIQQLQHEMKERTKYIETSLKTIPKIVSSLEDTDKITRNMN